MIHPIRLVSSTKHGVRASKKRWPEIGHRHRTQVRVFDLQTRNDRPKNPLVVRWVVENKSRSQVFSRKVTAEELPNSIIATIDSHHCSVKQSMTQCIDTSFCYYVDVEIDRKFISCCGPGEWMVCNCLSERDDYLTSAQAGNSLASIETEELKDSSDVASKPEDLAVPSP